MRKRNAFALIYVLMILAVVVMVTGALLSRTGSYMLSGGLNFAQYQAQNAAEAGLADALNQLEQNSNWVAGFNPPKAMPGGAANGSYLVCFSAGESINNLNLATATSTRRGANTLPGHCAFLVVEGRYGRATRTLEAVVVPGLGVPTHTALGATGKIELAGDMSVKGLTSLTSLTPLNTEVHSNETGPGTHIRRIGSGTFTVQGSITSGGNTAAAIDLNGATGISTAINSPEVRFDRPNITGMVSSHVSNAGPPIPTTGGVILSSTHNHYGSSQTVDGDLVLQHGAKLYVDGDLTVNGSVRGEGAVIVTGQTIIHGDSSLTSAPDDYVSVLSKGHVVLQGFDGSTYLNNMASSNPVVAGQWDDLKYGLQQTQQVHDNHPHDLLAYMSTHDSDMDGINRIIGRAGHAVTPHYRGDGTVRETGTAYSIMNALPPVDPMDPARDRTAQFLRERMQRLDDIYRDGVLKRDGTPSSWNPAGWVESWYNNAWDPVNFGGIYDAVQSAPVTTHINQVAADMVTQTAQYDYRRIGTAQFKGLVYTEGAFVAQNEVNLLGAVIVNGDRTLPDLSLTSGTYHPGNLHIEAGSNLTYVEDLFRNGNRNLRDSGLLTVSSWMMR